MQIVSFVNGLLNYLLYANTGQTNTINQVPDFSLAGYKSGGVEIPFIETLVTVNANDNGNDATNIQNAINQVALLELNPDGFRGAVRLTAGSYTVDKTLWINHSGIVIRGETGAEITFTKRQSASKWQEGAVCFWFHGSPDTYDSTPITPQFHTAKRITDTIVPTGLKSLTIENTSSFSVGEMVMIRQTSNNQWLKDMNMDYLGEDAPWVPFQEQEISTSESAPHGFHVSAPRKIVSIENNTLTLDTCLMQTIDQQYGGGQVEKFDDGQFINNVGIENLRIISDAQSSTDENHGWDAIRMYTVRNAWARQITCKNFAYACVAIRKESQFVTVEDSAVLTPKSVIKGGRRYSFPVDDSPYILFQRLYSKDARHDYASHSLAPGPVVFVDSVALSTNADTGPHQRYSTGHLYDNVKTDELRTRNRHNSGSGHGWTGAQLMFWNSLATKEVVCDTPNGGMTWAVGCTGTVKRGNMSPRTEPQGYISSKNQPVIPRSLYYAQLAERKGRSGLQSVIIPLQDQDTPIWTDLQSWAGNGLFGDPVIIWADKTILTTLDESVKLSGVIRDLDLHEDGLIVSWQIANKPSSFATFSNISSLDTTVIFHQNGSYVVELVVNDLPRANVDILVGEPTVTKLIPIEDAYVRGGINGNNNYNSDQELKAKNQGDNNDRKSYFKFDLRNLTSSSLESAVLRLYLRDFSGNGGEDTRRVLFDVYSVTDNTWNENDITWNNSPNLQQVL